MRERLSKNCMKLRLKLRQEIRKEKIRCCSHHPPHKHGLMDQTKVVGKIVGGSAHKIRGIEHIITIRGGNLSQDHRSPFSVVAALVPTAHMMSKRTRQRTSYIKNVLDILGFGDNKCKPMPTPIVNRARRATKTSQDWVKETDAVTTGAWAFSDTS